MHVRAACSLLAVAACATAPPAACPIGNRDRSASAAPPGHVERARWVAPSMTGVNDYPAIRAALRAAPGTCLRKLDEAFTDRAAFFAMTAAMAGTGDRCVPAAEVYVADVALALDREGPGCKGDYVDIVRAWGIAARLASTGARRGVALRNRAEAMWRQLDRDDGWSPARGAAVARAFHDALAAGDRSAASGEVDAWIDALLSAPAPGRRAARDELAATIGDVRARASTVEPAQAARLHAAIDAAGHALAAPR